MSGSHSHPSDTLKPNAEANSVAAMAGAIKRRRLATPALLFLVGHRPLAFAAGQILYALQPVADLMGVDAIGDLAAALSDPQRTAHFEESLASCTNTSSADSGRA